MSINHRLATYGTLAPGKPNHYQLLHLEGRWSLGKVRGNLVEKGWGAALGFPALVLAENGQDIDVQLFESADLALHWDRLDAFEGSGYRRVVVQVCTNNGWREAWIYINADPEG